MSTAGALPQVTSPRQNGSTSNTPRAEGERHKPTPKSSNSLSSSRRKLSSGRHSAGRLLLSSSAFPGNLVVSSTMALSPDTGYGDSVESIKPAASQGLLMEVNFSL